MTAVSDSSPSLARALDDRILLLLPLLLLHSAAFRHFSFSSLLPVSAMEFLVRLLDGRTACFTLPMPVTLEHVHAHIQHLHGVPVCLQRLYSGGRLLRGRAVLPCSAAPLPLFLSLSLGLEGGKGGFGSLLRATTSQVGVRRTSDVSAMRDLRGRRVRHVEQERALEQWRARDEAKGEDERRTERAALQRRMSDLKHGRQTEQRACKWGADCKYAHSTCRRTHPQDAKAEAHDGGRSSKRRRTTGQQEDGWQAQVVHEEDMLDDLQEGFRTRTHGNGGAAHAGGSDEDGGDDAAADADVEGKEGHELREPRVQQPIPPQHHAVVDEEKASATPASVASPLSVVEAALPAAAQSASEDAHATIGASGAAGLSEAVSCAPLPPSFPSIDLSAHATVESLLCFGLPHLSAELRRHRLKAGGSLRERAERLWLMRGAGSRDALPRKLWATG